LQQQTRREKAINHVVRAIRQSLDLQAIFSTAVSEIAQLLDVTTVKLVQYCQAEKVWRTLASNVDQHQDESHQLSDAVGYEIPDSDNPIAVQLKQLQVVQISDAANCTDPVNQAIAQQFPGAWLLIPISSEDQLWGSLTLMRPAQTMTWQPWEVEIGRTIAEHLAIAIQQSHLYQQVQQLNMTLEDQVRDRTAQLKQAFEFEALLKRITDKVRDSLDEQQILYTVVRELAHGIDAYSCDSGLYDLGRQTSTIAYEYVATDVPPAQAAEIEMAAFPIHYQQLLSGQPFQFCWLPDLNFLRPTQRGFTVFACPLIDDQGVIGDLWLYRAANRYFDDTEMRLVQQVATQCAIAIRQARLYEAAQAQVRELERLNRLKDDFLSTVSHELRTPMSSIQVATQMLDITLQQDDVLASNALPAGATDRISRYLDILQSECAREIGLINDLLDLSRLEAGVEPLSLMPIDAHLWLAHIAEPFLERTKRQQQQLQLDLPPDLPQVITDLSYLERVLTELLQNACKYTPTGETITVVARTVAQRLQIQVINSGVHIPPQECDRIFDKFYRIPNNDPWKHGGTGLGLALVKRLVARLGGFIKLTSPADRVIFTVTLPLQLQIKTSIKDSG
jgi:signal transduction histidine kinase